MSSNTPPESHCLQEKKLLPSGLGLHHRLQQLPDTEDDCPQGKQPLIGVPHGGSCLHLSWQQLLMRSEHHHLQQKKPLIWSALGVGCASSLAAASLHGEGHCLQEKKPLIGFAMGAGVCIFFGNLGLQLALTLCGVTIAVPLFSSFLVIIGGFHLTIPLGVL